MITCLSISDLSEILGTSASTLYRLRRNGCGPPYFRLGSNIRYRVNDVRLWIEGKTQHSKSVEHTSFGSEEDDPLSDLRWVV